MPQLDVVAPTPLTFEAPLLTVEGEGYDFLMAVSKLHGQLGRDVAHVWRVVPDLR